MRRLLVLAAVVLVGAALPAAAPPRSARALALPFRVTKVADTNDGACDADCSLREAIIAANGVAGADTVAVRPGR